MCMQRQNQSKNVCSHLSTMRGLPATLLHVTVTAGASRKAHKHALQPCGNLITTQTIPSHPGLTRTSWRPGMCAVRAAHTKPCPLTTTPCSALPTELQFLAAHVRHTYKTHVRVPCKGPRHPHPAAVGPGCAPGRACRAPAARTWAAIPGLRVRAWPMTLIAQCPSTRKHVCCGPCKGQPEQQVADMLRRSYKKGSISGLHTTS